MSPKKSKKAKTTIRLSANPNAPADLRAMLASSSRAKATWDDITPKMRRDWILWIITAKQEKTRRNRIAKARDMLSSGKRRVCCFGGYNWLVKNQRSAS